MVNYILDKYLNSENFTNLKNYIKNSGIEFGHKDIKFLPGYTKIPRIEKPNHLDPQIREWEEELFMLHDLLHQLFPMNLNCSLEEYSDQQVMGELVVFYYTEYYIQNFLIGKLSDEYDNYILNVRGFYKVLSELMVINNYDPLLMLQNLFFKSKNDLIVRRELENYIIEMFVIDFENSKHNYKLLTEEDKGMSFTEGFKTIESHFVHFANVYFGNESPYINKKEIKLKEEWI